MEGLTSRESWFLLRDGAPRHRLALDTMVFAYAWEANPAFLRDVRAVLSLVARGRVEGVASTLVLAEALVPALRQGREDIAQEYRRALLDLGVRLIPSDAEVAAAAARLRARHGLRTPDAIHVATAIHAGADAFVTGDADLARVQGIEVLLVEPAGAAQSQT